ncbi:hypothetical protein ILYODFUR_023368, partial [Ilyodon furcidens]
ANGVRLDAAGGRWCVRRRRAERCHDSSSIRTTDRGQQRPDPPPESGRGTSLMLYPPRSASVRDRVAGQRRGSVGIWSGGCSAVCQ